MTKPPFPASETPTSPDGPDALRTLREVHTDVKAILAIVLRLEERVTALEGPDEPIPLRRVKGGA